MFIAKVVIMVSLMVSTTVYGGRNFHDEFEQTFGDGRLRTYGRDAQLFSLSLDQYSGAGFCSKKDYLFGRIDMEMKLVAGDSAGTVTTLYLSSDQSTGVHDEIDFEFLGNVSGQPYTLHTNVFSQGKGGREQQFHLWFDPTKNFHKYTIVWNTKLIMFMVDESPIRIFRRSEDLGVPFPKKQPMKIYSSLWNADDWATMGGRVKTNWTKAPFTAYYRNFNIEACTGAANSAACASEPTDKTYTTESKGRSWRSHDLDANGRKRLRWAQKFWMVYDYCKDSKRYSDGFPPECKRSRV